MKYIPHLCILLGIFLVEVSTLLPSPLDDSPQMIEHQSKNIFKINIDEIEDAIEFASKYTGLMNRFENTIKSPTRIVPGTPAHASFLNLQPDQTAVDRGRQARLALKASCQLAYSTCYKEHMNLIECNENLQQMSFHNTSLGFICDHLDKKCSPEEELNSYRSIDGTCNHIDKAYLGESYTAYTRFLNPHYINAFEIPKRSVSKAMMPLPRKISSTIVNNENNPHEYLTSAFTQWGIFIEEDLSRFASTIMIHYNESIGCCDEDGLTFAPRYIHPSCMPIAVPLKDKFYKTKRVQCMNYVRSITALRPDCSMGHREQMNQATHYLDGSQIYGPSAEKSLHLRDIESGKLKTSRIDNKPFLPLHTDAKQYCMVNSDTDVCFKSGDNRVNFIPQLTVMQTLWMREHNRLAEELTQLNEDWDAETVFQEARRIVIAEMQHITYNEWIKYLLDTSNLNKIVKYDDFNKHIDPTVSNEFATSGIRVLYAMIPNIISLMDENNMENSTLRLLNHFNNPGIIVTHFDSLLRGLANQRAQKIGVHYSMDLTNNLFADAKFGYDLLSFDIQRGRDHGLPGYNFYRQLCGLPKVLEFKDLKDVMSKSARLSLSLVYKHVDDIDLIIGGLLEKPVDSLLGPTMSCIIADQFMRTKQGDRFFYTNTNQPKPFSELQLNEIRKVTLARIFCDNSDIGNIQREVFKNIDDSNSPVSCTDDSIPKLNLMAWNYGSEMYLL